MVENIKKKYFTKTKEMPPDAPPKSIPIRFDVKGNAAVVSWSPEQVKEQWKNKHLYEIAFTDDDDLAIFFGDVDVKTHLIGQEFEELDGKYKQALTSFLENHRYALATASDSEKGKISWRFYMPNIVGTATAQRQWAEKMNTEKMLVIDDNTPVPLDIAVYHKGRKMRMLHAWKQTKDQNGILIDDITQWENRPLRLVEGTEEDTMLHKITEHAERMTAVKKQLPYDEFGNVRRLVLECLGEHRTNDYMLWRNTLWAIKTTENTERGLELAHDFSKKSSKYDYRSVEQVWREGKNQITAKSIHYWARSDDPVKYAEIVVRVPLDFLEQQVNEGDIGLARIFVKVYQDTIVSIPSQRRTYWAYNTDAGIWEEHKDDYIITLFTANMKHILNPLAVKLTSDFKDVKDDDDGKKQKVKINKLLDLISMMTYTKTAVKCLSQISTSLSVKPSWEEGLNSKKDIFPAENGVIELRTKTLRPYELEDYLTYKIPVKYDEYADTSKQIKFFNDVLHEDQDAIQYIHYFLGYCMTGETSLQKALILEGSEDGANAKSVLMDCMLSVLGKNYYTTLNRKALALTDGQNNDSLYNARFSRMVCIPEMNKNGNNLDEGLIKNITGDDEIDVSAKFKSNIQFHPQFKVCMPLNEMFPVSASAGAVWRRLIVMPFKVRFLSCDNPDWDEDLVRQRWIIKRDDKFAKDLKADKEGWLKFLVQGASDFYTHPDREPPASLQKHLIQKQMENDVYLTHINKEYVVTKSDKDYITVRDCARRFPTFDEKEKVMERRISVAMKKMGVVKGTKNIYPMIDDVEDKSKIPLKTKVWFGIRIKTFEERENEE